MNVKSMTAPHPVLRVLESIPSPAQIEMATDAVWALYGACETALGFIQSHRGTTPSVEVTERVTAQLAAAITKAEGR